MGTGAALLRVTIGGRAFDVEAGSAARQSVTWRPDLWASLAGVPGGVRLLDQMAETFPDGKIARQDLWHLAAQADDKSVFLVHLATMAWGLGTNVRFGRAPTLESIATGTSRQLLAAREAANGGLAALWRTHFQGSHRPPKYLGRVAFGTKWLHAAGWLASQSQQARPVIFDQFVHNTLSRCLEIPLHYPGAATGPTFEAWQSWCALATQAAASSPELDAADVELAVFAHSRDDACPRSRGDPTSPCMWGD